MPATKKRSAKDSSQTPAPCISPATATKQKPAAGAYSHRKALAHLRRVDPKFGAVIDAVGKCRYSAREEGTHFGALVRSIVYQQLSGKAAGTIHARLRALHGDRDPTPAELIATPEAILRGVGLSRQKMSYLLDLASRVERGELPLDGVHELSDEELTEALVQVKGIGRWTAQMFLMFRLGRTDVLPDLDLGIQKGLQRAYGLRKMPKPKDVLRHGEKWAPYRTIASWYLWHVLEVENFGGGQETGGRVARQKSGTRGERQGQNAGVSRQGQEAGVRVTRRASGAGGRSQKGQVKPDRKR
jgi:3-methyladenine DNA glycosylase/8-oxoguanine DNA glycosylase